MASWNSLSSVITPMEEKLLITRLRSPVPSPFHRRPISSFRKNAKINELDLVSLQYPSSRHLQSLHFRRNQRILFQSILVSKPPHTPQQKTHYSQAKEPTTLLNSTTPPTRRNFSLFVSTQNTRFSTLVKSTTTKLETRLNLSSL